MFDSGLLEEVKSLIERGYGPAVKGFEAIGYRYAADALKGEMSVAEAVELTQRDTRRYAKRQLTWFRKESAVNWISAPGENPKAEEKAMALLGRMGE
jgi:tRNA dimethylallyltransferase